MVAQALQRHQWLQYLALLPQAQRHFKEVLALEQVLMAAVERDVPVAGPAWVMLLMVTKLPQAAAFLAVAATAVTLLARELAYRVKTLIRQQQHQVRLDAVVRVVAQVVVVDQALQLADLAVKVP